MDPDSLNLDPDTDADPAFQVNPDLDTDPFPDPGIDDQKVKNWRKKIRLKFFLYFYDQKF